MWPIQCFLDSYNFFLFQEKIIWIKKVLDYYYILMILKIQNFCEKKIPLYPPQIPNIIIFSWFI